MRVPLFAALGLAGIVAGAIAYWVVARAASRDAPARRWRVARGSAAAIGVVLAALSWLLRDAFAYAADGPNGPGLVHGFPFFVAFVDDAGGAGLTFLTFPLALLNAVFWFLLPNVALAVYARAQRKEKIR